MMWRLQNFIRRLVVLIALGVLSLGGYAYFGGAPTTGENKNPTRLDAAGLEVRLDYGENSIWLRSTAQNTQEIRAIRYSAYQGRVLEIRQGAPASGQCKHVLDLIQAPKFHQDLQVCNRATPLIEEGDPFSLSFYKDGEDTHCSGLVHLARTSVQDFIRSIPDCAASVPEAGSASAYIRANAVSEGRAQELRRRSQVIILGLVDFSKDLQYVVEMAIARRSEFLAIESEEYSALLPLASHGHDLFVAHKGVVYQLSLYRGNN
jgi:hypothetical protein